MTATTAGPTSTRRRCRARRAAADRGSLVAVTVVTAALVAGCSGASTTLTSGGAPAPAQVAATAAPAPMPSVTSSSSRPVKSATTTPRPSTTTAAAQPTAKRSTTAAPRRPQPRVKPSSKPTTKPSSKPAPPATGGLNSAEAEGLRLVNVERAKAGCGALRSNAILLGVARAHSRDMGVKGYFDHNSQDGRSPFDRMRAAGYRGNLMAENIAAGQRTAAAVMSSWMNSPGHRANILNCGFKVIGMGAVTVQGSPMRIYWTQNFGDR